MERALCITCRAPPPPTPPHTHTTPPPHTPPPPTPPTHPPPQPPRLPPPHKQNLCLTVAVRLEGGHKRAPPPRTLAQPVGVQPQERNHLQRHSAGSGRCVTPGAQHEHAGGHAGRRASWHARRPGNRQSSIHACMQACACSSGLARTHCTRAAGSPSLPQSSDAALPAKTRDRCPSQTGRRGWQPPAPAPAARSMGTAHAAVTPACSTHCPVGVQTPKQTGVTQLLCAPCTTPCGRLSLPLAPCSPSVCAAPAAAP